MFEKIKRNLLFVISGIVVSLISGLYSQDLSSGAGAVIVGYGLPLHWLEKMTVVIPGNPSNYTLSWYGLAL